MEKIIMVRPGMEKEASKIWRNEDFPKRQKLVFLTRVGAKIDEVPSENIKQIGGNQIFGGLDLSISYDPFNEKFKIIKNEKGIEVIEI